MSINVFMCYAHEDKDLLNKLHKHLRPVEGEGLIKLWCDLDISAGSERDREISEHLNAAQMILILVSSDLNFYESAEVKQALERYEHGEARVIPIILRHVVWQHTPLGKLQALPKQADSVVTGSLPSIDHAWEDVVNGIRDAALAYPNVPEEQVRRTSHQAISFLPKQVNLTSLFSSYAIMQILVLIKRAIFIIFGNAVHSVNDLTKSDKGVQGLICLSLDVLIISVPLGIHFSWWVAVVGLLGTVRLFGIGRSDFYDAFTLLKAFIIAGIFGFLWSLMLWLVFIRSHGEPIFTSLLAYLIIGAAFFIGSFFNFIQF